jgi:hypothetical protein
MRGIYNTRLASLTGNTIQNCSVYGTGASVLYGIWNTGGSGTVDINTNKIISCSNTGTGIFVGITNSAIVSPINLNNNIIRNLNKTARLVHLRVFRIRGSFTSISINGNQLEIHQET